MKSPVDDGQIKSTYHTLLQKYGISADEVLVCPTFRSEFLELSRQAMGEVDEATVLRRLLNLRKRGQLPRR